MEGDDLPLDEDLLVREVLLLCVEELYTVLDRFLLFVLIHHGKVVSLGVEVQLELLSVVEGAVSELPRGDLNEAHSGMLLVPGEGRIH